VSSSLQKKLREAVLKSQRWFLHKTGLMMVSRKLWISPELDQWIRDFKPDVIYATTGDICKLNFIAAVTERYGAKLAIHIYDDFVNSRHQYTAFPVYWRKRLDRAFRRVVDLASLHLSISEKMAREYTLRYGRRFFAYHNPIDPSIWISSTPKVSTSIAENVRVSADISMEAPFTFVYAGKVNQDTQEPLLLFISACDRLRQAGHPVQIKIYSPYPPAEVQMRLGGEACSGVFMGRVSYTNLPDIFRQADALLLPLDFSDETVRYIRLSMLTKATEYMIAGTPIFLFAPGAIAVSEYLLEHDAAFHADSPERLESDILSFIRDEPGRRRIARNGFKLGIERHMQEQVGRQLRDQLSQLCCD
jgi:glycosyltransferase involved in cell wall biosynthesis